MISSVVKEYLEVLLKPLSLVLGNVLEEVKKYSKNKMFTKSILIIILVWTKKDIFGSLYQR